MPAENMGPVATVAASETPITTFSSDKEALADLLLSINRGKTQLPDFQRGWVWDDDHIRSLLASITLSFPIGSVMMLETGGKSVGGADAANSRSAKSRIVGAAGFTPAKLLPLRFRLTCIKCVDAFNSTASFLGPVLRFGAFSASTRRTSVLVP